MTVCKEVLLSADILIKIYDNSAEDIANKMMVKSIKKHDDLAISIWFDIIKCIKDLRAQFRQAS